MLEHRNMPDVNDVFNVRGVGRGPGIGLRPALITGATGEFDQRGTTVGVGSPRHVRRRQKLSLGN